MFSTCLLLIRHSSGQWAEKRSRSGPVWMVWPDVGLLLLELRTLKEKQQYMKTPGIYLTFFLLPHSEKKRKYIIYQFLHRCVM